MNEPNDWVTVSKTPQAPVFPQRRDKVVQVENVQSEIGRRGVQNQIDLNQEGRAQRKEALDQSELRRALGVNGNHIDTLINTAEDLYKSPDLELVTGWIEGQMPSFVNAALKTMSRGSQYGQRIYNAQAKIDNLKNKATLQELRELKAGGATLGSVSEYEDKMLRDAAARLQQSQDLPSFRQGLQAYIAQLRQSKANLIAAARDSGVNFDTPNEATWVYRNGKLEPGQ